MAELQVGHELDAALAGMDKKSIEVHCVNNHPFKITEADLKTTETGKSAIAFCPVCGGVARVNKGPLGKLMGFKRADTTAYYASLKKIRSRQMKELGAEPTAVKTVVGGSLIDPNGVASVAGPAVKTPDLSRGGPIVIEEDKDFEDEDEDDDDEDDDEDEEYEAEMEDAEDEEEPAKKRFRVKQREESRRQVPRKATPQRRLIKRTKPRRYEEEEMEEEEEEEEYEPRRGTVRRGSIMDEEDIDPNEVLKDIIEEAGFDESTLSRLFDYIDLQPDGWQPAAIQGMLQMYIPPMMATRIASRYQAELYKITKKREMQQQAMAYIGHPTGNMRLQPGTPNIPPIMNPLQNQYGPGAQQFNPQNPMGFNQQNPNPWQQQQPYPQQAQYPPQPPIFRSRGVSTEEVREIVNETVGRELRAVREMFQQQMAAQEQKKKEDALLDEIRRLREQSAQPQHKNEPDYYVKQQGDLLNTLMAHILTGKKEGTDVSPLIINELRNLRDDLKKGEEAGGLPHPSQLQGYIELQRLTNEMNLARSEFDEKRESRQSNKDLIENALGKVGEIAAQLYMASVEQAKANAAATAAAAGAGAAAGAVAAEAITAPQEKPLQQLEAQKPKESEPEAATVVKKEDKVFNVSAARTADLIKMQCPVEGCGGEIICTPQATRVICSKNAKHVFELEPNVPEKKEEVPTATTPESMQTETPEAGTSEPVATEPESVKSNISEDVERAAAAALETRSNEDENPRAFLKTGVL